ncbi:MAG: M1 family metallopeptidase [Phycisphaerales bacterium]|nr:M1 family metallopeptidase [Planctomycetota bacterium]MBL6997195.1 M1 family metallopeptidase [Phycisphaerales bacterium]
MRLALLVLILMSIGCEGSKKQESFLHNGDVFRMKSLPEPSGVRTGSGAPGEKYWQQRANHSIQVRLDVETNTIHGNEVITYYNNSPDELSYIWIQLEQNVHREDSIRSREGRSTGEREFQGIHISHLAINRKNAKWQEYCTIAKVLLDEPLLPNNKLELSIEWSFAMPTKASMRMGYDESYEDGPVWELAQWFPTPCVYDDVHGWNTLPYIGRGEFYTNFGDYDVEITVPDNHVVLASGALQNQKIVLTDEQNKRLEEAKRSDKKVIIRSEDELIKNSSGEQTWKFKGKQIRTFAWATSASFIWEAASVEIDTLDGSAKRVLCQVGYPNEESDIWDEGVEYLQHSIKYYSDTMYPYPWPVMSMARGKAGGMEYPMLIFCRGSSHEGLFNVTDHEVGHNWFPMIVNTDERRHAWMDEGFNTFVNHYSLEAFYGEREHKPDVSKYIASKFMHDLKAINTPPDLLKSRRHLSYRKPGYGLRFLREEILGEDRFDEAWKAYIHNWAFKSPRPADFYRAMENGAGVDLQWFFKGFFEETMQLDQAITSVKQNKDGVAITFENLEDWVCPVDVTITCEDGSSHWYKLPVTIWAWSNQHKQTFKLPSKVMKVELDASSAYPDINLANNTWTLRDVKK